MTSQVAVANHSGVAVASDTVTTAFVEGGTKSIGNSHKIWEIGKSHRVLILHSGSVTQNGVTNKLLVNEWAATLQEPLNKLSDYVDSFIQWMNKEQLIHTPNSEYKRASSLLNDHYYEVQSRAIARWNEIPVAEEQFTSKEEILNQVSQEGLEYLSGLDFNPGFSSDSEVAEAIDNEVVELDAKLDYIFSEIGLTDFSRNILKESANLVLSRNQDFPGSSTIAFVGFGTSEYFAGNIRLRSKGFYAGKFIYQVGEYFCVSPEFGSSVTAFAQDEAIWGFVRGFRWPILDRISELIEQHVNERIDNDEGENVGEEIAQQVRETIYDFYRKRFTDPLLDSIEGLDLSHLANLADSLVGMEATSAFGGDSPATVGGFIEVATIDRQNGIVWVKKLNDSY
jgi:hypothetical protein